MSLAASLSAYRTRLRYFGFLAAVGSIGLAVPAVPLAQETTSESKPAPTTSAGRPNVVELPPVRVVAQKRLPKRAATAPAQQSKRIDAPSQNTIYGEKLQRPSTETTTSVGVVTGERVQQEQIFDFHQALNATANTLATRADQNNAGIVIRGINSEGVNGNQNAAAAPVISVIVDGAVQNAEAVRRGLRSLWDVEQVEVLRGPQSTIQGRNAAAGAVFIKTKDPVFSWLASAELTAATHNLYTAGVVVSGPIVANELAFRVAGQIYRSKNDITYTDPANEVLGKDRFGNIRGKVLWTPAAIPELRALFTVAHTDDRPSVNSVSGPDFFARVYDTPSGTLDYRGTKTNNYVSDVAYELLPGVRVRSVTSFAATDTDVDSAPTSTVFFRDDLRKGHDFTQDLRLEMENRGNGLSGVLGFSYGNFKNRDDSLINIDPCVAFPIPCFGMIPFQDTLTQNQTKSLAGYADLRYRFLDRWVLITGGRALRDEVSTDASGFQFAGVDMFGSPIYNVLNDSTNETFKAFVPKLGVTYDLTTTQTIGFTYSQGYRAGFGQVVGGAISRVSPEFLDAYEVSYRSLWLDDTLGFNTNVFYYDYSNQQVAVPDPIIPAFNRIVNGGKSHSYGAEFETLFKATNRISLYASIGLLFTRFDEFVTASGNFSGNEFPEAPSYTVNVGGMYKDPQGWFVGANARFIDGFYSNADVANDPLRYVSSATIVDARAGWEHKNAKLTVFAKNLFDERYLTSISSFLPRNAGIGDSRQIGASLTLRN